jgi:hypothetical protein
MPYAIEMYFDAESDFRIRALWKEFATMARDCWSHYSPPQWVPHCTLAMGLESQQMARALDICQPTGWPLLGTVTEIGLIETRPIKQLYAAPFAN